jgi:hypothetical protein
MIKQVAVWVTQIQNHLKMNINIVNPPLKEPSAENLSEEAAEEEEELTGDLDFVS